MVDEDASFRPAIAREATERAARNLRREIEARFALLTPRENEVLAHVLRGALNKQIADALRIDLRSVKRHRTSFMTKLGVDSVARLVGLAQLLR